MTLSSFKGSQDTQKRNHKLRAAAACRAAPVAAPSPLRRTSPKWPGRRSASSGLEGQKLQALSKLSKSNFSPELRAEDVGFPDQPKEDVLYFGLLKENSKKIQSARSFGSQASTFGKVCSGSTSHLVAITAQGLKAMLLEKASTSRCRLRKSEKGSDDLAQSTT